MTFRPLYQTTAEVVGEHVRRCVDVLFRKHKNPVQVHLDKRALAIYSAALLQTDPAITKLREALEQIASREYDLGACAIAEEALEFYKHHTPGT